MTVIMTISVTRSRNILTIPTPRKIPISKPTSYDTPVAAITHRIKFTLACNRDGSQVEALIQFPFFPRGIRIQFLLTVNHVKLN